MKESNSDRTQQLAERFVYMNDDSAFHECMKSMEVGIKNYIKEFMKSKNVPRISTFIDEVYDATYDNVYDNARAYYDKERGQFSTWVYRVANRNCVNAIRPFVANRFYVVSPDVNDIESNTYDEDSSACRYKVAQVEEDKMYTYEINGENKISTYKEMIDDVVACIYSCIYSIKCVTDTDRKRKEMVRMLYIENKTMQEVSEEFGCKICNVKNAVTVKKGEILAMFKEKYSGLYNMMISENVLDGRKREYLKAA
jgi:DNA-directed RNA polymerase specialized sigma24 family protein